MDCDRIEECNLSTQPYYRSDIRAFKAKILANNLYLAIGVQIEPEIKRLTDANTKQLLGQSSLVIDAFDNSDYPLARNLGMVTLKDWSVQLDHLFGLEKKSQAQHTPHPS
jgi:molybdopterin/thiamine biosynthesis adenylyltransferase